MTTPPEHKIDPHHETVPLHDPPDAWHDHSVDPRPQQAHGRTLDSRAVILVGLGLFATVMIATFIVYQYYVWYTTRMLTERASVEQRMVYTDRIENQQAALNQLGSEQYLWRDHDTVLVPLDTAMDQVISTYQGEGR